MKQRKTLLSSIFGLFKDTKTEDQVTELLKPSIECHTESEFTQRMLLKISGLHCKVAIVQQPDKHTQSELEYERQEILKAGGILKIPSLIVPYINTPDSCSPYILVFTYDKKLFIYPYDDEAFWT